MPAPDPSPLWRQILRQSFWGKRGISKTGTVWLPAAVILAAAERGSRDGLWLACLLLFAASACRTQALILANDIADRADDQVAGKNRWILRVLPAAGVGIVALVLLLGVGILLASGSGAALAAYVAASILGLLYSVRPVRFKERGLSGLVVYSLACALAYAVVPWAWFKADPWILAPLSAAVFLDRWVNLQFHQVIDYEADRSSRVGTYAVRAGLGRSRQTLRAAAALASLALAAVLAIVAALGRAYLLAVGIAVGAALAAGAHARASRRDAGASTLVIELPWHYLGLTFSLFRVVPPVLFAVMAVAAPALWMVAAAAALTSALEMRAALHYREAGAASLRRSARAGDVAGSMGLSA